MNINYIIDDKTRPNEGTIGDEYKVMIKKQKYNTQGARKLVNWFKMHRHISNGEPMNNSYLSGEISSFNLADSLIPLS